MLRKLSFIVVVAVTFFLFGFSISSGSGGTLGLGVIVGSTTGIAAEYYLSEKIAVDTGLGWSLSKDVLRLQGDLIFHDYKLLKKSFDFPLVLYFGGGVKSVFAKKVELGARMPVGALYDFKKPPIDVFFELVPVLTLIPDTGLDFDAAIGARYYFSIK